MYCCVLLCIREDIPQIDGESYTLRNTDCWWEKHRNDSLRAYQTYHNVFLDIEEIALGKEESPLNLNEYLLQENQH